MITKLNISKIGGFLLAIIIVAIFYVLFTLKTESGKIENLPKSISHEVVSANNISMKLISAHTEGSGYRVELCYNLPDQRDWLLTYPHESQSAILSVAEIQVSPIEEGTMYWKYDLGGKISQRCQYLFFAIQVPSQTGAISLRVGKLYARELVQSDYCLEVSQKMVERSYSVEIDCMNIDGMDGLVYVKFPVELLSMDPSFKKIFRDVKWDTYSGPWSFTFPVNPP